MCHNLRARRHRRGRRVWHMSAPAAWAVPEATHCMKSRSKSQLAVFLHRRPFSSEHWDALSATPDAPEEATQRPPFLALRGPSHSHPAALLHRRRRITPWQASSPASSGSFGPGTAGRSAGLNGTQYAQGKGHHQGRSRMMNIPSHQQPSGVPSFGTCPSMWSSIWLMALAEKVLEQVRLGFMTAPDTWLLPALCPSSCITRPTLHPREDCVAWEIPYSYSPFHASPVIESHMTST